MSEIIKPKFGWKRDLPDFRDHKYKIEARVELPPLVDLRHMCPGIYDQIDYGSCTANALGAAFEYAKIRQGKETFMPSRMFLYYNEREVEGTINEDSGAMIRTGIKTLVDKGVCPETLWEYKERNLKNKPTVNCYENALTNQVLEYLRITPHTLYDVKHCLSCGDPVSFGFMVYESFMDDKVKYTGMAPIPGPDESPLGGHAVCCLPGTIITTDNGFIPIEDIEVGDVVMTHDGTFKKVLNTFSRDVNEEIYRVHNNCGDDLRVTKEHPLYTKYYSPQTKLVQTEKTNSFLSDIKWSTAETLSTGNLLYCPISDKVQDKNNNIIYDKEFFELLGMYIGDGNIAMRYSKNGNIKSAKLRFSLGKDYPELIARCKYLLGKYSNNGIGIDNFENHVNIVLYDTSLARRVGDICGYAKNKQIPADILFSDTEFQKSFIEGWYQTDGCRVGSTNIISTAEYNLYQSLIFILKRLRLLYSVTVLPKHTTEIKGKLYNCKESYHIHISNTDETWNQIRTKHKSIYSDNYLIFKLNKISKEPYTGKVYNFEVEDNNSYVANGIAVHNCAVGYDDEKKCLIVRNSWGTDWGIKGYFYMPYWYIDTPNVSADFWTIKLVE